MIKDEKDACYHIYPLDYEEILSYKIQDYYWSRSSYLNYFEEPNIPSLKKELHVEKILFLKIVEKSKNKI